MKTKTLNNNTSQWNVLRKQTVRNNPLRDVLIFNHMTIITAEFKNKNNKPKRLVQSFDLPR